MLSILHREKLYAELVKEKDLQFQLASCGPATIDKINIYQASRLAMRRAIKKLESRSRNQELNGRGHKELDSKFLIHNSKTMVLVDGKYPIAGLKLPQQAIVKGDRKVFAIACASIIAKVTRDRIMTKLAKRYPQYGFEKHKGYGTRLHQAMLTKHGICAIHRKSFAPVAKLL